MNFRLRKEYYNPLAYWLISYLNDESKRFVILWGGSSSGKTYSLAQTCVLMTMFDGENTLIYRKVGATIKDSIYEDFKVAIRQLKLTSCFEFKDRKIVCIINGARIDFKGLDDSEKIKGISNYKRVCLDELSEFLYDDFRQIRKRLRGKKGQQIIVTFNPIRETHWIKTEIFDKEEWHDVPMEVYINGVKVPRKLCNVKSVRENSAKMIFNPRTREYEEHEPNMVAIQTTYLNNFWVVGSPDGKFGFYDHQCIADFEYDRINDPDYYNVYALGEWGVIRTGAEFFSSFNQGIHCKEVAYNADLPIHISVDNNVLPYISFTFWQVQTYPRKVLSQFDEVCAGSPNNTIRKAAKLVADKVKRYGESKIYLHGDASTRASNNIDDEKRSWIDLLIDALAKEGIEVIDCVGRKNPSVSISGEFINAIFEGAYEDIEIIVNENCRTSIEDYMSAQKDVNGAIAKTRVKDKASGASYEQFGHLSDTFRYVVCDLFKDEFTIFSQKRKHSVYGAGCINFYNPDTLCQYSARVVYAIPNIGGKFCMVYGARVGDYWHITDARLFETDSTARMAEYLTTSADTTIIECGPEYYPFVRELRKVQRNVRVIKPSGDTDKRISATSDFVKNSILFNPDAETQGDFLSNLLDYRKGGDNIEASAVMSGFARYVIKSFPQANVV